jgi:hypothetical protein
MDDPVFELGTSEGVFDNADILYYGDCMRRTSTISLLLLILCKYPALKILSFYLAKILMSFLSLHVLQVLEKMHIPN